MNSKVLFVDDEPLVLEGIRRQLRNKFEVLTAVGGRAALAIAEQEAPIPVIVSDMRMPEMDGVQFLYRIREKYPDSARMILSGQSDLDASIRAVNQGAIFRFLTKPIATDDLVAALNDGFRQYRLVVAERELLDGTLLGSIRLLSDILATNNPTAATRANRVQRYAMQVLAVLGLERNWELEMAGLLSQLGCLSIPEETVAKVLSGQELPSEQQELYNSHPQLARQMLASIPRMEGVAEIVAAQHGPVPKPASPNPKEWSAHELGCQVLRAVTALDGHLNLGRDAGEAIGRVRQEAPDVSPLIADALIKLGLSQDSDRMANVHANELQIGMVLREPIVSEAGILLIAEGHEVTETILLRIRHYAEHCGVRSPFLVAIPRGSAQGQVASPTAV